MWRILIWLLLFLQQPAAPTNLRYLYQDNSVTTTYFGACDSSGNPSGSSSNSDAFIVFWHSYTCPGSGNQTVNELSADVHREFGSPLIRLAIYNAAGTTLIAQGTTNVTPPDTTDGWCGYARSGLSVNPLTLVGGTDYILAYASVAADGVYSSHVDETRSEANYKSIDYSGGFPASLPTPDSQWAAYPVRCGVEQEASILRQMMAHHE